VAANCINAHCGGLAGLLRKLQTAGAPINLYSSLQENAPSKVCCVL